MGKRRKQRSRYPSSAMRIFKKLPATASEEELVRKQEMLERYKRLQRPIGRGVKIYRE